MLCQNCKKRVASVHLTQVINNHKTELYLCEHCAKENSQINIISSMDFSDFFSSILGSNFFATPKPQASSQIKCDKCGITIEEFKNTGKLGCEKCYHAFSDRTAPVIRRIHGNVKHVGKVPPSFIQSSKVSKDVEMLRTLLEQAIHLEEYEKAADIRDKMREIEAKKNLANGGE